MASQAEVLSQLKRLAEAYPEYRLSPDTTRLYCASLGEVPLRWLARAVREWISTQKWFPKISELRQTALRLAGVGEFYGEEQGDALMRRYHRLCQRFWREGELDEPAWLELAAGFAAADRPHMAARARQRLEGFRSLM